MKEYKMNAFFNHPESKSFPFFVNIKDAIMKSEGFPVN